MGIRGAGEQELLGVFHVGEGLGVLDHRGHIDNRADVEPAIADKDADAWGFTPDIALWGILDDKLRLGKVRHHAGGFCRCGRSLYDRLGDIFGSGQGPTNKYTRLQGPDRLIGWDLNKPVVIKGDTQGLQTFPLFGVHHQSHGEHEHIERLSGYP